MKCAANRKKAKGQRPASVINRRAGYDYQLSDKLIVGLSLTGTETRAARQGHVSLQGAYVTIKATEGKSQLILTNASFTVKTSAPRGSGQSSTSVDTRPRNLLARRREIDQLAEKKAAGYTIIPTKLITGGKYIKLEIALGRGKKKFDKREVIKKRDQARENARLLKR